jgi:hypothetical protein
MHSNLLDETAIAQAELNAYVEAQANASAQGVVPRATAPELIPLVRVNIKVERVGFTSNASRTPYIVYKVGDRRCSTFVKRQVFFDLVRMLLKFKYSILDRICSITSAFGHSLSVDMSEGRKFIPRPYVNKFFERYNQVALERVVPQPCECNDLFDMCPHLIAGLFI